MTEVTPLLYQDMMEVTYLLYQDMTEVTYLLYQVYPKHVMVMHQTCSILFLKEHNLICLPNKIRLNLINTFVMSRNKHISKKTPCFSRKRSKNKAQPNEFERRILKLSCYACSDNPKCWHALACLEMRVARMNFDFTFYDVWLRPPLPRYNNRTLKNWIKLDENEIW